MDEKADDSVEEPQPFVDLFGVVDENDEKLVKKVDSAASTTSMVTFFGGKGFEKLTSYKPFS